jgi:GTPase
MVPSPSFFIGTERRGHLFVDEAKIWVKAGDGGPGCIAFRREKYIPMGGPSGGDGGDGGSVYFVADENLDTLLDFLGKHHWKAGNGLPGSGKNMTGANGDDMIIRVPVGTLVYDTDHDILLKDIDTPGMKVRICRGGRGGLGNKAFATSVNQAPRTAQPGKPGQERNLRLELKLIADVGLVGMPNAGKSTLISRSSAARPKIADYPFTTLEPVLGIVELSGDRRFVMADIPGLIEGAHVGTGLGFDFLRHIERTRIIVHMLDLMPMDGSDPAKNYKTIRKELAQYSQALGEKKELIVANKTDLDPDGKALASLKKKLKRKDIIGVSAATGEGIKALCEKLWTLAKKPGEAEADE